MPFLKHRRQQITPIFFFGGGGGQGESIIHLNHAPVVQNMDSVIHRINNYPTDKC